MITLLLTNGLEPYVAPVSLLVFLSFVFINSTAKSFPCVLSEFYCLHWPIYFILSRDFRSFVTWAIPSSPERLGYLTSCAGPT